MNKKNEYKLLLGAYYGIRSMDDYDLKVYLLKDIEKEIRDFIEESDEIFDYKEYATKVDDELSLITKLQDSLIVLNRINAPMEVVFLVKKKLKELKTKD